MNQPSPHSPQISGELLLQLFDLPVSFQRCLVPISGSVTAALMLSQAIWTTEQQAIDSPGVVTNGWFTKSQDEWTDETGLTRWEQETARRTLRRLGFVEERRAGMPAKLWFRVRSDQVWKALRERAAETVRQNEARKPA
jgi:hypothetical protein